MRTAGADLLARRLATCGVVLDEVHEAVLSVRRFSEPASDTERLAWLEAGGVPRLEALIEHLEGAPVDTTTLRDALDLLRLEDP